MFQYRGKHRTNTCAKVRQHALLPGVDANDRRWCNQQCSGVCSSASSAVLIDPRQLVLVCDWLVGECNVFLRFHRQMCSERFTGVCGAFDVPLQLISFYLWKVLMSEALPMKPVSPRFLHKTSDIYVCVDFHMGFVGYGLCTMCSPLILVGGPQTSSLISSSERWMLQTWRDSRKAAVVRSPAWVYSPQMCVKADFSQI